MQALNLEQRQPLHDLATTRQHETTAAAALPAHTLMQRAGLATAQLAQALAPHARCIWIACGSGNNGGDGLEAALQLHQRGRPVQVTWLGQPERAPADAHAAWQRARQAGVVFCSTAPTLGPQDLCIDALLGIGLAPDRPTNAAHAALHTCLQALHTSAAPVLCVDVPSGLCCDSGQYLTPFAPSGPPASARHTLSLLTLKPGLFTGAGRDAAGRIWFDDLGAAASHTTACAWLPGAPAHQVRAHASHKGSFGDVVIVGGEGLAARGLGMGGAAVLAARAALHAGAGRVLLAPLDADAPGIDASQPELMLRQVTALDWAQLTVVCGCGGGAAVRPVLAQVLALAPRLVLDADALNAIAAEAPLQQALHQRAAQGQATVLTPHPLEAARLLGTHTAQVQAQRLQAAQTLATRFACTVVLKGSGSIIAAPGQPPAINPTGNARLATAGTGDVLAGLLGTRLAQTADAWSAACAACWQHGALADAWPPAQALTASRLAQALTP
ncbi:NAD(P)H-hydrate dehydratase [Acidovorax sp. HDW3]|uniref:NAD(P)H-hydrate dehydratase n=1 Tax=Acidovorax sp. HDW3 TaxID=2714923 RepID=UPI001407CFA7|nr:NAD(P)H-hydrate dehydratase [Acidovorax sp. HDW3]QIL43518.1 NAD(P)H-hydrate dehydratase [Acidovorax sp. HDW3]